MKSPSEPLLSRNRCSKSGIGIGRRCGEAVAIGAVQREVRLVQLANLVAVPRQFVAPSAAYTPRHRRPARRAASCSVCARVSRMNARKSNAGLRLGAVVPISAAAAVWRPGQPGRAPRASSPPTSCPTSSAVVSLISRVCWLRPVALPQRVEDQVLVHPLVGRCAFSTRSAESSSSTIDGYVARPPIGATSDDTPVESADASSRSCAGHIHRPEHGRVDHPQLGARRDHQHVGRRRQRDQHGRKQPRRNIGKRLGAG